MNGEKWLKHKCNGYLPPLRLFMTLLDISGNSIGPFVVQIFVSGCNVGQLMMVPQQQSDPSFPSPLSPFCVI